MIGKQEWYFVYNEGVLRTKQRPLVNAQVSVSIPGTGMVLEETRTDSRGRCEFTHPGRVPIEVRARKFGWKDTVIRYDGEGNLISDD